MREKPKIGMEVDDPILSDILQWDVRSWFPALKYWEASINWDVPKKTLELGAREGGLALWTALNGADSTCSDRGNAETVARPLHEAHGVADAMTYLNIDATDIPFENEFDLIMFKSIIGGVGYGNRKDRQHQVFRQIHKALKPGGKLLFAENLAASPLHRFLRKRFVKWGDDWRYVTVADIREFTSEFAKTEIKTTGVAAAFGRKEQQRSMLAKLDGVFLTAVCPPQWRYIAYGIAEKAV